MKQASLAKQTGFQRYSKKTKRALFLEEMERVVPWGGLGSLVEPHYPKAGNGRRPVGVERMLRVYFLQQWFSLSDPAVEEALYDSPLMRRFAQIELGNEPVPVETTIIHAPSSTKNREQKRDPEMHQTRKGKQWYFGMKAHIGIDSKHKIIHSAVVTAANIADCAVLPELLHG